MGTDEKIEEKEVIASGSNEEADEVPEKVSNNECLEAKVQDGGNTSDNMDVSSEAIIEEKNESSGVATAEQTSLEEECKEEASGEGVDKVTGSEAEKPSDSALPSAPSDDKEKKDSEQKNAPEKRQSGRAGKYALIKELAALKLPDGIILVKDRRYTGYHCTYCNCVLKSARRMRAHVGGSWHRGTLRVRMVKEKRRKLASSSKSSGPPPNENVVPKEPLKSSLQDFLSTTKARVVGLSYVIETQRPNKDPTFQCNLCEVSCDSSDIKDHILGMKHCLMYSKLVKPAKLAELLAKQLTKAEKNKEIAKLSEELEKENGRGEITVKFLQTKSTGGQRPRYRNSERGRPGNRLPNRLRNSGNRSAPRAAGQNRNPRVTGRNVQRPQQRRNDGMSSAKKRQMLERDFQARVQYSRQGAQSNFSGWGVGKKPVDMLPYENDAGFYPKYPSFPRDSYGERSFNQQYMNERYKQMGQFSSREMPYRERYDDRQSYWNDRHDTFTSNKPSYSDRAISAARGERYSKGSDEHISALKHLAGLNVTSEEDAGVVINAINSLTNSVMNYKLRDLSQPVQQLLQKSLENNDLKSLLDLPDRTSGGSRDRYGGRSSQMDQNWGITQIAKPKNWLF